MIAHIAGVPAEETLLPLVSGVSTGLILAHAWLVSHRTRSPSVPPRCRTATGEPDD